VNRVRDRIAQELALLRSRHRDLEYWEDGRWVRLPAYPLFHGWNRETTDVAFQIKVEYPGAAPYGFYVPAGLQHNGRTPSSYNEPAQAQPPFGGSWGFFSWQVEAGWFPTADVVTGSNLLSFARTFADRFKEGA
jgi:hypothetical protein